MESFGDDQERFLALDKARPRRRYLLVRRVPRRPAPVLSAARNGSTISTEEPSNSLGNSGERDLVHLTHMIRHAYEIKVRRHDDQRVRAADGGFE
jgi:hypothetical protein